MIPFHVLTPPEELVRVIDAVPVPVVLALDGSGEHLAVNDAFRRLMVLDRSTLRRHDLHFHQSGLTAHGDPLERILSGWEVRSGRAEITVGNARRMLVSVSGTPLYNEVGAIVGGVAVFQDVEEQGHAARSLQELTTHTPALLFTADSAGQFDSINARWTEFIGEAADELLGSGWTRFVHPDDTHRAITSWAASVASGEPYEHQWRFRRKDGTYRWTEIRAEARRGQNGKIRRWFGSGTDVDAQRRALEALDFLAETGATVAGAQDSVAALLNQLADASLEGLADISIFDIVEEDGEYRRLVVASPRAPKSAVEITAAFAPPKREDLNPIARAIHDAQTIHIASVDEDFILTHIQPPARQDAWRFVAIRSIVCAPMVTSGHSIGALTLLRTGTSVPFNTADMRVIQEVARRAAVAVENVRLKAREEREARNLRSYADMGEAIAGSLGLDDTLESAMHVIVPDRADWAFVTLEDDHGDLRLAWLYHRDPVVTDMLSRHVGDVYARGENKEGAIAVMRTRTPLLIDKIDYEAQRAVVTPQILEVFSRMDLAKAVIVPLYSSLAVRGTLHLCLDGEERTFSQADVDFFQELARRLAPAIANAELFERERRVAREFQDAALPASLPDVQGLTFNAIYEAGQAEALIGGDWYDAFLLGDGRIVVSIGDVAGSGLSAAVTMSGVRQAIRGAAHVHADPTVMLEAANQAVLENQEGRFATAFVGVIDPVANTIEYQTAGHLPPLLWTPDDTLFELCGHGLPLGFQDLQMTQNERCTLPPGSLLTLYTDGLIESTRDVLEGEARVRVALLDPVVRNDENPAQMLHDAVLIDGSRDDVAILVIKTAAS